MNTFAMAVGYIVMAMTMVLALAWALVELAEFVLARLKMLANCFAYIANRKRIDQHLASERIREMETGE